MTRTTRNSAVAAVVAGLMLVYPHWYVSLPGLVLAVVMGVAVKLAKAKRPGGPSH